MNELDVLHYHTRTYSGGGATMNADAIGNADLGFGGAMSDVMTGRISLGMLSVAIVGVMFFYIATRGKQL